MGDELYTRAKEVIAKELAIGLEKVRDDLIISGTKEDGVCLGADSLDTIQIIMGVEEALGVEIPDDQAAAVGRVRHIRDLFNVRKAGENNPDVLKSWIVTRYQETEAYKAALPKK